jgi:hypothetical protein
LFLLSFSLSLPLSLSMVLAGEPSTLHRVGKMEISKAKSGLAE